MGDGPWTERSSSTTIRIPCGSSSTTAVGLKLRARSMEAIGRTSTAVAMRICSGDAVSWEDTGAVSAGTYVWHLAVHELGRLGAVRRAVVEDEEATRLAVFPFPSTTTSQSTHSSYRQSRSTTRHLHDLSYTSSNRSSPGRRLAALTDLPSSVNATSLSSP